MPISALSVIRRCVETLQDPTSIRWPVGELVRYLNDGQREIAMYRPDAMNVTTAFACTAGSRQVLPINVSKLIEVVRNTTGVNRGVRLVNREIMDAQTPGWHTVTQSQEVLHYMYDPRQPREFYVYPPAAPSAVLEVMYSVYPAEIAEPASGSLFTAVTGNISVPDTYGNTLADYILYRAYTKDSEYAGNAQRSQAYYAAFANALGVEIKGTIAVGPNPIGNPNRPAMTQA